MNHVIKKWKNALDHAVLLGFAGLLFISPFHGLLDGEVQGRALFLILGLFSVYLGGKVLSGENDFLSKPLDYLVLAFWGVYGASVYWAADRSLAWGEAGKALIYFLVYWLAYQLSPKGKAVSFLLNVIYFSGLGVALAGIAGAAGVVPMEGGFVNERISSTLGYPNSLAAYGAALVVLGMYLFEGRGQVAGLVSLHWLGYLYVAGNYLLLTVFFASGSRGAFLLLPAVIFVFLLGLPGGRRWPAAGHFVVIVLSALAANYRLLVYISSGQIRSLALWLALGLICALLGQMVLHSLNGPGKVRKFFRVLIVVVLMMVVGGGWLQVKNYPVPVKILPHHIVLRLQKMDLDEASVQARFVLWKYALGIVGDRPVLGLGGGAFQAVYPEYVDNPSIRGQVHNHYLKVWTETGTVGLGIFGGIWLLYFYLVGQIYRNKEDEDKRRLVWALFCAALMLGAHAFIDYDLSFPALSMVLFCFMGIVRGMEKFIVKI